MPKPNKDRYRINVDVGYRIHWLIDELCYHLARRRRSTIPLTPSAIVRGAVEMLARGQLPFEVYEKAPIGEQPRAAGDHLGLDGAGQGG
jgi:hypothetical protein